MKKLVFSKQLTSVNIQIHPRLRWSWHSRTCWINIRQPPGINKASASLHGKLVQINPKSICNELSSNFFQYILLLSVSLCLLGSIYPCVHETFSIMTYISEMLKENGRRAYIPGRGKYNVIYTWWSKIRQCAPLITKHETCIMCSCIWLTSQTESAWEALTVVKAKLFPKSETWLQSCGFV